MALTVWSWVIAAALAVAVAGLWRHLARLLGRPFRAEQAPQVGSPIRGVQYAFTWGMMPWAKESTRIHQVAYLRGIAFHLGIGVGFAALALAFWSPTVPLAVRWILIAGSAMGALAGFAGLAERIGKSRLRWLSTPDDFFSVALVSLFLAASAASWIDPRWQGAFFALGAATMVAIPFTKIRHCFYFFFSRFFFGLFYGRRGIVGGAHHE